MVPRSTTLILLAWLAAIAGAAADTLPRPAGLEPDIAFWRTVFGEATANDFLVHDNRYLGVIYEKFSLPAGTSDSHRRRRMEDARLRYERALRSIAARPRGSLKPEERRILAHWPAGISNDSLREAARRVRVQQGVANRFEEGLVRAGRWQDHIRLSLRESGVPESLAALPHVESSFNPDARSFVGAVGLWQFTSGTGRKFMRIDAAVDERRDPYRSSEAAARLLRSNYNILKSWPLAITAYNHGAGGMRRAVRTLGTRDIETIVRRYDSPSFGFASRNFYVSFLAADDVDREAARYFGAIAKDRPRDYNEIVLSRHVDAGTLARSLGVPQVTLQATNPSLLPPVWKGRVPVPRGYTVRLPAGTVDGAAIARIAAAPAAAPAQERVHTVRRGESLSAIAARYGTTAAQLAAINGLRSRNVIRAGQALRLADGPAIRPAAVAAARSQPATAAVHVVRPGEALGQIARRHGLTERELMARNGMTNPNRIIAGQKLQLTGSDRSSGRGASTYVVRHGDSLARIARRTGVSSRQLLAINDLDNPNRIYPGQKLRLRSVDDG
jgi:membrane-bound lytic murein transglycosylase D